MAGSKHTRLDRFEQLEPLQLLALLRHTLPPDKDNETAAEFCAPALGRRTNTSSGAVSAQVY